MAEFKEHKVARIQELKENKGLLVKIEGEEISLFKIQEKIFAIGNVCAHQHFSMLHVGEVNQFTVTCPMHGWTYDMRTGKSTNASGRVKTYDVVVRRDEVFILKHGDPD